MQTSHSTGTAALMGHSRRGSLVRTGGALGIAAMLLAMLIFLVAVFGFDAAFMLSILPFGLGLVGFVLTVIGAVGRTFVGDQEAEPIAAVFTTLGGALFGAVEMYFWFDFSFSMPGAK